MGRVLVGLLIFSISIGTIGCGDDDSSITSVQLPGEDIYVPDHSFKVVGYLPYYKFELTSQIEFDKLTYVNIAFGNLNSAGDLVIGDDLSINSVVETIRTKAPGTKVMLSLAGGFVRTDYYSAWLHFLKDPVRRQQAILKMVDFVNANDLDGLDVDIEGGLITDLGVDYNLFVQELRQYLHAEGKAITCALPGTWLNGAVESSTLHAFDFINLMVYDATGEWNPGNPGPHSPYSMAIQSIEMWHNDLGIDRSKLVLGMPFYGRDFDPSHQHGWMYKDIIEMDLEYAYLDEVDLLYYNGIPTIVEKTKLAIHEVNGVMFWELGQDTFNDVSLLRAVSQVLSAPCSNIDDIRTFYLDSDKDGLGDLGHPLQHCVQPSGYVHNRDDCDDSDPQVGC